MHLWIKTDLLTCKICSKYILGNVLKKTNKFNKTNKSHQKYLTVRDLIENKELALSVLKEIPADARFMRMNYNYAMFYQYDSEGKKTKFHTPHRYLRYSGEWVKLSIKMLWSEFEEMNGVFSVAAFKFALAKKYPVEILGEPEAWRIVKSMPNASSHYNHISEHFQKKGENGVSLFCTANKDGRSKWVESYHSNEFLDDDLINLVDLHVQLKERCRWHNRNPI